MEEYPPRLCLHAYFGGFFIGYGVMESTNLKVYFDTSTWNFFLDWSKRNSLKRLYGQEYLFSSCNLDEFCLSPTHRCQELASLAWRISNRKKLHDHYELTVYEIVAFQNKDELSIYDENSTFNDMWKRINKTGAPKELQQSVSDVMRDAKQGIRELLRGISKTFKNYKDMGLTKEWREVLDMLEGNFHIHSIINMAIVDSGLSYKVPIPAEFESIPYKELSCTSCWVQY